MNKKNKSYYTLYKYNFFVINLIKRYLNIDSLIYTKNLLIYNNIFLNTIFQLKSININLSPSTNNKFKLNLYKN